MNTKRTPSVFRNAMLAGMCAVSLIPASAQPGNQDKLIAGDTVVVAGSEISTWARVSKAGVVTQVGLTMPLALAENMPAGGSGPAGAFAVLNFPAAVKASTYFDHAEIHSEPNGHPNNPGYAQANRYLVPHFDFHFYGIPESQVLSIPFGFFFTEAAADRLPKFYAQPEPLSIPQMGRHTALLSEFTATDHWLGTMIAGFLPDASYMSFIEPMLTQELLLMRKSFVFQVPRPDSLGRTTNYPSECVVLYDKDADAFQFIFTGFHPMQ